MPRKILFGSDNWKRQQTPMKPRGSALGLPRQAGKGQRRPMWTLKKVSPDMDGKKASPPHLMSEGWKPPPAPPLPSRPSPRPQPSEPSEGSARPPKDADREGSRSRGRGAARATPRRQNLFCFPALVRCCRDASRFRVRKSPLSFRSLKCVRKPKAS